MESHHRRTGRRLTLAAISEMTGLSLATLQSLSARTDYNATLNTIARLCVALGCAPGELLELRDGT